MSRGSGKAAGESRPGARLYFELLEAAESGTPLLAFSRSRLESKLSFLRSLEAKYGCQFLMALKALPDPELLRAASEKISGFDVSNAVELKLAQRLSGARSIWVNNPAAERGDWPKPGSKPKNLIWCCDGLEQWRELEEVCEGQAFALRLDSDVLLKVGAPKSRFGFHKKDLAVLAEVFASEKNLLSGFHVHHGWQKNTPATYRRLAEAMTGLWLRHAPKKPRAKARVGLINLGGGFGEFSNAQLEETVRSVRAELAPSLTPVFEAGRFLSAQAGFAVGTVKRSLTLAGMRQRCVLDLSGLCHLQWSKPKLLEAIESEAPVGRAQACEFVGPTCFEGDRIGEARTRHRFKPGERVIFSGIVGYSLAHNHGFNGAAPARVRFIT